MLKSRFPYKHLVTSAFDIPIPSQTRPGNVNLHHAHAHTRISFNTCIVTCVADYDHSVYKTAVDLCYYELQTLLEL